MLYMNMPLHSKRHEEMKRQYWSLEGREAGKEAKAHHEKDERRTSQMSSEQHRITGERHPFCKTIWVLTF